MAPSKMLTQAMLSGWPGRSTYRNSASPQEKELLCCKLRHVSLQWNLPPVVPARSRMRAGLASHDAGAVTVTAVTSDHFGSDSCFGNRPPGSISCHRVHAFCEKVKEQAPGLCTGVPWQVLRQLRFRLHRRWLRIRRQRYRPSPDRKRLQGRRDGDGPALDAGESAADQLVAASLVLAAEPGAARLLQHALLPPRHHPARLRRGRRFHHLRLHLLRPPDKVWDSGSWKGSGGLESRDAAALRHRVAHARASSRTEFWGQADHLLQRVADAAGVGNTFYRTSVAIFQSPEGEPGGTTVPDPYFGGEGPERTTCMGCGGCMMGCRHGAKNTLDQNYLYLAEKRGAQVFAETE